MYGAYDRFDLLKTSRDDSEVGVVRAQWPAGCRSYADCCARNGRTNRLAERCAAEAARLFRRARRVGYSDRSVRDRHQVDPIGVLVGDLDDAAVLIGLDERSNRAGGPLFDGHGEFDYIKHRGARVPVMTRADVMRGVRE